MKRCALQLLPVAFFAFVVGGAGAAPEAFATVVVPIVVGWLWAVGVAISSLIALEITNYVGAGFSDMAGLIPALFGMGAFVLAVIAVGVHELELARIRRQRAL